MRRCCVPECSSTDTLNFCGSCERLLHEGCTRLLQWPLNLYCIYCLDCQKEPWLQGAFIQAGGKAGKAGHTYAQIKSAVEDIIKQHVGATKAAGRTTTYSGLRSAGREIFQQWEKMTDENLNLNIGFRFVRVPNSDNMRRSQVRWHLAMDWDGSPMAQGPQDAQALMQLADGAAEVAAPAPDAAAGAAGPELAIHDVAADLFNETTTADSEAEAAASACLEDANTTGAANVEPVSLAAGTKQTSTHSSPPSMPKVQTPRQASAAGASHTHVPMATKQASCAAPEGLSGVTATLAHDDKASASEEDGKSATAFVSNRVKHMEPSRVDNTAVKQSQNAVEHDRSLNADAYPTPKPARTIPNMFQKKRKAPPVELAHQLHTVAKPCFEVIDLVSDEEAMMPAATDIPSRHDFGCRHDVAEVIVIDDYSDGVVNTASADLPVDKIQAMGSLPILHRSQKVGDKKALIVDVLESLEQCDSRLSKRFKEEKNKCKGRAAYDDLISRMHSGLQETLEETEQLPMSEQENDVANYFRVFLGFQPVGNFI